MLQVDKWQDDHVLSISICLYNQILFTIKQVGSKAFAKMLFSSKDKSMLLGSSLCCTHVACGCRGPCGTATAFRGYGTRCPVGSMEIWDFHHFVHKRAGLWVQQLGWNCWTAPEFWWILVNSDFGSFLAACFSHLQLLNSPPRNPWFNRGWKHPFGTMWMGFKNKSG